jgi:hypothetical protein
MDLPQRHRDTETERGGDKGKRREGNKNQDCPFPLVSPSLWLCVSVASLICLVASAAAHDLFLKFDSFFCESNRRVIASPGVRADANGVARVKLTGGGKWFIKFIHMTKLKQADLDYESK